MGASFHFAASDKAYWLECIDFYKAGENNMNKLENIPNVSGLVALGYCRLKGTIRARLSVIGAKKCSKLGASIYERVGVLAAPRPKAPFGSRGGECVADAALRRFADLLPASENT
ncbi:MAG TPA: hypothetical protein VGF36_04920, partial [Rhodopila sp.]